MFTDRERDLCYATRGRLYERLAVRFAAKEAVLKALGTGLSGGIRWTDVEIVSGDGGRPGVRLFGQAKREAEKLGVTRVEIALSHSRQFAVATATALKE